MVELSVSRIHCEVRQIGDSLFVVDQVSVFFEGFKFFLFVSQSKFGTFVNDDRILNEKQLCDGDLLKVGVKTVFKISCVQKNSNINRIFEGISFACLSEATKESFNKICKDLGADNVFVFSATSQFDNSTYFIMPSDKDLKSSIIRGTVAKLQEINLPFVEITELEEAIRNNKFEKKRNPSPVKEKLDKLPQKKKDEMEDLSVKPQKSEKEKEKILKKEEVAFEEGEKNNFKMFKKQKISHATNFLNVM